jgi:glycosyltransferase involved in cell wall biosynthesis
MGTAADSGGETEHNEQPATRQPSQLHILAWPRGGRNPYIPELYGRIRAIDPTVTVSHFRVRSAWRTRPDVVHVHWPEGASNPAWFPKALAKTAAVLATLRLHKRRGAKIVWTAHNLRSHEIPHPRLDAFRRDQFDKMVDGVIHLSTESQRALESDPALGSKPSLVVAMAQYADRVDSVGKATARRMLGLEVDTPVIGHVGIIRQYKNVPQLIRAFARMTRRAQLIVGGNPHDEEIRQEVQAEAAAVDNLLLDDRWLSDEEMALRIDASDVIVLAYDQVHNSGVAVLVLGKDRPVVVRPQGSMAEFETLVGSDWVYPLDEPLTGPRLDKIIDWATQPRSTRPDLSAFDPDTTARKTLDFLADIAAR